MVKTGMVWQWHRVSGKGVRTWEQRLIYLIGCILVAIFPFKATLLTISPKQIYRSLRHTPSKPTRKKTLRIYQRTRNSLRDSLDNSLPKITTERQNKQKRETNYLLRAKSLRKLGGKTLHHPSGLLVIKSSLAQKAVPRASTNKVPKGLEAF